LAVAMLKNNFHCLRTLLNYPGVDVNCKDDNGKTLLSQTIFELSPQNIEHIEFLIKKKVLIRNKS